MMFPPFFIEECFFPPHLLGDGGVVGGFGVVH